MLKGCGSVTEKNRGAVDKAFDLLRAFGADNSVGLGVSELARRSGMSKSTAFRLLATLVENEAVQKAGDVYRIGPLFFDIVKSVDTPDYNRVGELLTPYLSALFERTRQTVHLGYLVGTDVVYANKLFSLNSVQAPSRIGGRVPGYCTGVGKAIMAWDEDLIEEVIAAGLPQWSTRTITDPDEFRAVLAKVREEGVAYDREEITPGLTCVAAPIYGRGHIPVAAMSVSGATGVFRPEDHIVTLKKVAASASKAFMRAMKESGES